MVFNGIMPANYGAVKPAAFGLFSVPGFVQHAETETDENARWQNGFEAELIGCMPQVDTLLACLPITPATAPAFNGSTRFKSVGTFMLIARDTCSTASQPVTQHIERVKATLRLNGQQAAERAFYSGVFNNNSTGTTPGIDKDVESLSDSDVTILADTAALSPAVVLSRIESELSKRSPLENTIHISVGAATLLAKDSLIAVADDGTMRTKGNNNLVIVGAGYSGTDPGVDAGDPLDPDEVSGKVQWIHGTGPVHVHLSAPEVLTPTPQDAVKHSTNEVIVTVAQTAAVYWDSCIHVAAKTTLY